MLLLLINILCHRSECAYYAAVVSAEAEESETLAAMQQHQQSAASVLLSTPGVHGGILQPGMRKAGA